MAFISLLVTLLYGTVKFIHVVDHHNPFFSAHTVTSYYSSMDRLYLKEKGFRMAFTVEGYFDRVRKDDPRYVKWIARLVGSNLGEEYEKILPIRECNENDWADFATVSPKNVKVM